MSTKKSTIRKSTTSRDELRQQLARDIASILNNPETPTTLYNDVADRVSDMSSDLGDAFWHSPEQIKRDLDAHFKKEAKRKGGTR
jgi:gas vesicle protein